VVPTVDFFDLQSHRREDRTDGNRRGNERLMWVCLSTSLFLMGCTKKIEDSSSTPASIQKTAPTMSRSTVPPSKPKPSNASSKLAVDGEAAEVYKMRCALCHGDSGAGDGVAAASSPVQPRSFRSRAWQKQVTDDHLRKVILEGGMAAGLSALMAPNPDLKKKPKVLADLIKIIRGFKD